MSKVEELRKARVAALEAYSELEHSIIRLLGFLASTDLFVAYAIFTRIGSTHARIAIARDLWRLKFKDADNPFINSTFKSIRELDQRRNNIVHWTLGMAVTDDREDESFLAPGALHKFVYGDGRLSAHDLTEFSLECWFVSAHITMYLLHQTHPEAVPDEPSPWLDIFQKPIDYPPLEQSHPLFQSYEEQRAQLLPSQP